MPTRGAGELDSLDGIEEVAVCSDGPIFCQRLVFREDAGSVPLSLTIWTLLSRGCRGSSSPPKTKTESLVAEMTCDDLRKISDDAILLQVAVVAVMAGAAVVEYAES